MSKTALLILAAGTSSRMGSPKQLLPYKHTTLLGWTIEQAQHSNIEDIFCVLGASYHEVLAAIHQYPIQIIRNPEYHNGLSTSIVRGVQHITQFGFERVFILLGDQPHVTTSYLNAMLHTAIEFPTKIIASNYTKKIGVPAIFPKNFFSQLRELQGDKGAKSILKAQSEQLIPMKAIDLTDIDTPEDYQKSILKT